MAIDVVRNSKNPLRTHLEGSKNFESDIAREGSHGAFNDAQIKRYKSPLIRRIATGMNLTGSRIRHSLLTKADESMRSNP